MPNKAKIRRYIDSAAWDARIVPPSLHIAITDLCWNNCKICGHWRRREKHELWLDDFEHFVSECEKHNLETVCFTGGDPLNRYKHFNRMAELCLELGIDYGVVTAGWKPSGVDVRFLKAARWVRCSMDAVGSEPYAAVRGGSITWTELKRSLHRLYHEGVNLQVFTTISRFNKQYIEQLYQWLYDNSYMFSEFRARPAYRHSGFADGVDTIQMAKLLGKYQRMLIDASGGEKRVELISHQFTPAKFEWCQAVKYQWFVSASGNVYPCCITAGDTESKSRVKPLGHITDGIGMLRMAAVEWSEKPYDELPPVCRNECAPRFNTINTLLTKDHLNEKNFF